MASVQQNQVVIEVVFESAYHHGIRSSNALLYKSVSFCRNNEMMYCQSYSDNSSVFKSKYDIRDM